MLYEESIWFKNIIQHYVEENSLVLNIGSSTKEFIEIDQPYIKQNLFDELANKTCDIKNCDIKKAEGVDLVGDVTDTDFIQTLKQLNPSIIICSNLLEHLENRKIFCDALVKIMNPKTLLIISVPYLFPYHEDPIDTMYRPDIEELQKAFPTLKLVEGKIVNCGTFFSYSNKHKSSIIKVINFISTLLMILPASLYNRKKYERLSWNLKNISATCAIYKLS